MKTIVSMKFDIIIPVAQKDINFLPKVIEYVQKCIPEKKCIYIITSMKLINHRKIKSLIKDYANVKVINENELIDGLTFETIDNIIHKATDTDVRTGWFYQQFLKYAFALSKYSDEYYLTWDADTLPLTTLSFFNEEQPFFTLKTEYHLNYFHTIKKVLNMNKCINESFIAEHMLFNTNVVKELINSINESSISGNTWYEKIINACDFSIDMQAFSEFETYGTYCVNKYPSLYAYRKLCSFRRAGYIRGRQITDKILHEMSFDLDMASFEWGDEPAFPYNLDILFQKLMRDMKKYKIHQLPYILFKKIKKRLSSEYNDNELNRLP